MERKKIQQLNGLGKSTSNVQLFSELNRSNLTDNMFSKALVAALQNQLKQLYGYQISKSSLPVLSLYFEYFSLLKYAITEKQGLNNKKSHFLTEYNKYHSQEEVSKLLLEINNKNREFRQGGSGFRQECLLNYFGVNQFTEENVLLLLVQKVSKAKNSGFIKFQVKRSKKRQKTFFPMVDKENKVKHYQVFSTIQTRKNITDRQSQLYYEILALKLFLKEETLDPVKTNELCESIKFNLEGLFNSIKVKNVSYPNELFMQKKTLRLLK